MILLALSDAATSTIISILIWFVLFPGLVTGMIAYAIVVAHGEAGENDEERRFPRQ